MECLSPLPALVGTVGRVYWRCDSPMATASRYAAYLAAMPRRLSQGRWVGLCYVLPELRRFDASRGEWVSLSFGRRVGPRDLGAGCLGVKPITIDEPCPEGTFRTVRA